jgi:hypothetical protein
MSNTLTARIVDPVTLNLLKMEASAGAIFPIKPADVREILASKPEQKK